MNKLWSKESGKKFLPLNPCTSSPLPSAPVFIRIRNNIYIYLHTHIHIHPHYESLLAERVSSTCPDGQKILSFLSNGRILAGLYDHHCDSFSLFSIYKNPPLTVVIPAEQFRTPWTKIPTPQRRLQPLKPVVIVAWSRKMDDSKTNYQLWNHHKTTRPLDIVCRYWETVDSSPLSISVVRVCVCVCVCVALYVCVCVCVFQFLSPVSLFLSGC